MDATAENLKLHNQQDYKHIENIHFVRLTTIAHCYLCALPLHFVRLLILLLLLLFLFMLLLRQQQKRQ